MQQKAAGESLADPRAAGGALAAVVRERLGPLTLGMVFPFSNHNFDLRYWLASAGVHPDHDVRLVAIPPPLMVDSLRAGLVDGFCVGEPWNSLAAAQELGSIVATQSQLFPHAVEKVLAMRASLVERTVLVEKLLQALDAAAAWVDDPGNRAALAAELALPRYLGVPQEVVAAALDGRLRIGDDEERDADFLYFHRHAANAPRTADGLWIYAQMVRWGQLAPSRHAEQVAAQVFRPDVYRQSLPAAASAAAPTQSFDRVAFSASDVPAYLGQFDIHTPFAHNRSG
jgi:ABC-type nitrate/sulfonate/bicarbonate transport system substrate-binding protein